MSSEAQSEEAQSEELTLLVAKTKSGYFGVAYRPKQRKPYQAQVWRGGTTVSLGCFATAEEAALCVARSPEGQTAAQRAASAPTPLTSEAGAKDEPSAMPSGAVVKEEGAVPPMPPDAFVKVEVVKVEVVVKEERSGSRPKRLRKA